MKELIFVLFFLIAAPVKAATITLTISDPTQAARAINDLAAYWGYQATINGQPNPQTKAQFVHDQVAAMLKQICAQYERNQQVSTDEQTIQQDVNTNVSIQ